MRMIILYILFLAFCTDTSNVSTDVIDEDARPCVSTGDSVTYYESQIRLADSLYKNYLPQYNFDEVKKAVAFFEESTSHQVTKSPSRDDSNISETWRLRDSKTQQLIDSLSHRLIDSDFLRAQAHYYHAVGLTERDDVVGACEHYLRALEIMEPLVGTSPLWRPKTNDKGLRDSDKSSTAKSQKPKVRKNKTVDSCLLSVDNPQDYEKIRFVALIYTRLGELFHNENCISIAKDAYKRCINFYIAIDDSFAFANNYKQLGEIFAMGKNYDSSLYFYKKSIESLDEEDNQITRDSWKGISAVLHHNGNIDSSYKIIKNLISRTSGDEQFAYKTQLAQMYYKDNLSDSALIYFEEVLNRNNKYTKISASNYISKIYLSKGDIEKSNYYLNLYSDKLIGEFNRTSYKSLMVELYNEYKNKRLIPSETNNNNKYLLVSLLLCVFILVIILCLVRKVHTNKSDKKSVKTYKECIDEFRNENIYSKINLVKNEYIKSNDTNKYKEFQFCNEEKEILIYSINKCFNDFTMRLILLYPNLNTSDVVYCCLILLDLENKEIGALMGVQYQSVKDRLRKLSAIFDTEELSVFIKNKCSEFLS